MFKQFYKDIDTLHELVKPFRVAYILNDWQSSFEELGKAMAALVVEFRNEHL